MLRAMSFDESNLDIFHRRASPISCEIVCRWREAGDDSSITGTVRGPECAKSRMLPATFTLRSAPSSDGKDAYAVATIPDPCFWSPALPAFYRVTIDLLRPSEKAVHVERSLGIRPLDIRGRSFYWEARRWVPRAVCFESLTRFDWDEFREQGATLCIREPEDDFCRRASDEGILLLARIGAPKDLLRNLRRLARWSAVAFVLVEGESKNAGELQNAAPNMVLVERYHESNEPTAPAIAVDIADESLKPPRTKPAIAIRRLMQPADAATARSSIDRLQRDLAPGGDWAGYIV